MNTEHASNEWKIILLINDVQINLVGQQQNQANAFTEDIMEEVMLWQKN